MVWHAQTSSICQTLQINVLPAYAVLSDDVLPKSAWTLIEFPWLTRSIADPIAIELQLTRSRQGYQAYMGDQASASVRGRPALQEDSDLV